MRIAADETWLHCGSPIGRAPLVRLFASIMRKGGGSLRPDDAISLLNKCRAINIRALPTIDLPDDELAAVAAAIRRAIEDDKFPRAPRLDPLRAALARLEAASKPTPDPKAPPPGKADKSARR